MLVDCALSPPLGVCAFLGRACSLSYCAGWTAVVFDMQLPHVSFGHYATGGELAERMGGKKKQRVRRGGRECLHLHKSMTRGKCEQLGTWKMVGERHVQCACMVHVVTGAIIVYLSRVLSCA